MNFKKIFIILLVVLLNNCFRAKKSPFDLNNSTNLFGISFLFVLNQQAEITISGIILGKSLEQKISLSSGRETKVIENSNTFSFNYPKNTSFNIQIISNPTGLSCKVINGIGTTNNLNKSDLLIECTEVKPVQLFPTNGKNWGDYIQRDYSKDILSQIDTPCDPNLVSNQNYFSCIHGAEILRIELVGKTNCDSIQASDDANNTGGALNWICSVKDNKVYVYSLGFREGDFGSLNTNPPPGLSDLIDWNTGTNFKLLKVTIKEKDIIFLETTPSILWNNSFRLNPSCSITLTSLGFETNTIFTFSSTTDINISQTNPCQLGTDKTSLVINPKIRLTSSIGGGTLLQTNNRNFIWIEGYFNGLTKNTTVFFSDSKFLSARNFIAEGVTGGAGVGYNLRLSNISLSYFKNLAIANTLFVTPGIGLNFESLSEKNIFYSIKVFNNVATGINLNSAQSNLFINLITNSNNGVGLNIASISNQNMILNSTYAFNSTTGITVNSDTYMMNSLITNNNNSTNFGFDTSAANLNSTVLNTGLFNNNSNVNTQIQSSGNGTTNFKRYLGQFKLSLLNCTGGGTVYDGLSVTNCNPIGQSDFTVGSLINFSILNPFISSAKPSSDSLNPNITASGLPLSSITNFSAVQSFYRVYGVYNLANFPNINLIGRCTSQCSLFDLALTSSDLNIRNSNNCPQFLSRPTLNFVSNTFLRNVVEIIGDWKGDDDGLCESNEDCIYTPNLGAYQGHGNLIVANTNNTSYPNSQNQCGDISSISGVDGTVSNIKLFKYEKNGF